MPQETLSNSAPAGAARWGSRIFQLLLTVVLAAMLLYPWSTRLKTPSIILDDLARIERLRTLPLTSRLVAPFNEHLAPVFETVTTLTWWLAGGKLEHVPLVMSLASYVPFLGCLAVLWLLVRKDLESTAAAWIAVALFAATPIYAECVYWYSASSFTWALLFSLAGLWFVAGARGDKQPGAWSLIAAAACGFVAPASSAIGVLGGPIAALRGLTMGRPLGRCVRANLRAAIPLLGTAAYFVFAFLLKHQMVVSRSLSANGDLLDGLAMTGLAPAYLMLAGYLGISGMEAASARWLLALTSVPGGLYVLSRIWLKTAHRRWTLIAVMLILAGYGLIYCVRVRLVGPDHLLGAQRYHLFPCAGLVMLIMARLAGPLRRLDHRPLTGLGVAALTALGVLLLNRPLILESPLYVSPHLDQPAVMRALDRLAAVARTEVVSRAQVIDAFDPIEPRWCDPGGNILRMLPETASRPLPGHNPREIRSLILSRLSPADRAALLGSSNLTNYVVPDVASDQASARQAVTLVDRMRLKPLEQPGHYLSLGWPNFLEFTLPNDSRPAAALALHGLSRPQTWELRWADDGGEWSRSHVIVLEPAHRPETTSDWILPLDRIPLLNSGRVRRIRLGVRNHGPVAIKEVTLLR